MRRLATVIILLLVTVSLSSAAMTYSTASGATLGGLPVSVDAVFTISGSTIDIQLTNNIFNPTGVIQALAGIEFTLSNAVSGSVSGTSTGQTVTVNTNAVGGYTTGPSTNIGWGLSAPTTSSFFWDALAGGPAYLVLGASNNQTYSGGAYAAANGSLLSAPHNPFSQNGSVLEITGITGLTMTTTITSVTFYFGTAATHSDSLPGGQGQGDTPEPSTMGLLGVGLLAVGVFRQRIKNRRV